MSLVQERKLYYMSGKNSINHQLKLALTCVFIPVIMTVILINQALDKHLVLFIEIAQLDRTFSQ
jgi:hypothetical protein